MCEGLTDRLSQGAGGRIREDIRVPAQAGHSHKHDVAIQLACRPGLALPTDLNIIPEATFPGVVHVVVGHYHLAHLQVLPWDQSSGTSTDILGFDNLHSMLWVAASKGPTLDPPGHHMLSLHRARDVVAWGAIFQVSPVFTLTGGPGIWNLCTDVASQSDSVPILESREMAIWKRGFCSEVYLMEEGQL